jgi:hypothetical protein
LYLSTLPDWVGVSFKFGETEGGKYLDIDGTNLYFEVLS